MQDKASYSGAGVDIEKANRFVERIKPLVKSTHRKEVMGGLGGFGALFHLDIGKFKDPVLVSTTDGVGTKVKIAQLMDSHDTIGIDLVAMSVNDVIVQGAEPLFFLDYIATGKLDIERNVRILEGIVKGCQEAGCALIGGETAEMPGIYGENEYDLAGFCVGVVEADRLIDGSEIRVGDRIVGIASNGLHSNGFSLARQVLFERGGLDCQEVGAGFNQPLGAELLRPTRIYVKSVLNVVKNFQVRGIVHITGGGFTDNIPRIIPNPCRAVIERGAWETPAIFRLIQKLGRVEDSEMFKVFNMGIGMMLIVPEKTTEEVLDRLIKLGDQAYVIGTVEKREADQSAVSVV
ncbi:MAG: phosphoribosylformylglycinamidine cyclo-ligase [Deltaproteobacteria bacterium]|nr:phosphoribosylformylglycinamidine cyclo-ligase [Deltaproteobacteria bacterium]